MLSHIDKIVNSIGLLFDLIGAWLVAWEVVKQFHGSKFGNVPSSFDQGIQAAYSSNFINWEKEKYCRMKIGIVFLTIGFILQLISNWIICILVYFKVK